MARNFHVAILGATGAVGRELLQQLEERDFPVEKLTLLASPKSEGEKLEFKGEELPVRAVKAEHFQGVQLAFFCTGPAASAEWAPVAVKAGAMVVDGSSAFRAEPDVPMVVPEVNPQALARCKARGIVANPNCATVELVVALKPLHDAARVRRVVVSTYQSVSGLGQHGVDELEKQTSDLMNAREVTPKSFPHRIAFNVLPQIGEFLDTGYTQEEAALAEETRKILEDDALQMSVTAVRVPVFFGHSEALNVSTERKLTAEQARELFRKAPGLKLLDDPKSHVYPMPMLAAGDSSVHVGRVREDASQANGLDLFVCADNVRKGAALNAVQIGELLIERGLI